jgi:tetratricopeptide (TPR) repeat protein
MSDAVGYEANLRRGQVLRESGRFKDACTFLREAIAADPQQPQPYLELALALSELPGGKAEALRAAERCVALAPDSAHFIGYRAYILAHLALYKEALQVAETALKLDPNRRIALLARANAFTKTGQWWQAEQAARRILQLDAEDTGGLNLLAQSLRFQGRHKESRAVVLQILALVPEDAFGQANAGFEALNAGDPERARRHFINALRVNPHSDNARRGLLQSLRARMWFYRVNLKLISLFDRSTEKSLLMRMLIVFLLIGTGGMVMLFFLLYLPLGLLLQPISNFFLLLEPMGRHALARKEKIVALVAGAGLLLAAVFLYFTPFRFYSYGIAIYLALFALGVYVPRGIAVLRARREEKRLAAGERTEAESPPADSSA